MSTLACSGGHRLSAYEQNTQQSPDRGFSVDSQFSQSKKNWHASAGISAICAWPQTGQASFAVIEVVMSLTGRP